MKKRLIMFLILAGGVFLAASFIHEGKNIKLDRPSLRGCESEASPVFTSYPTDIEMIVEINPPFMEVSGDLKGHSYIDVSDRAPIYAPVDSVLTDGVKYEEHLGGRSGLDQYLLHFEVSCEVFYWFDHVIDPPDSISSEFKGEASSDTKTERTRRVEVKAGDLIGYSPSSGQHNFDFGVGNTEQRNEIEGDYKYINSRKYKHASCPYSYYPPEMRSVLFDLIREGQGQDLVLLDNLCVGN